MTPENLSRCFGPGAYLGTALLLGLLITGCGSSVTEGAGAWRLLSGSINDPSPRNVSFEDGEKIAKGSSDRASIVCEYGELSEGQIEINQVSINVPGADPYAITIRDVVVPEAGGSPTGSNCEVTVTERNDYVGACGGGEPTEDVPCQMTNIVFAKEGGRSVTFDLACTDIRWDEDQGDEFAQDLVGTGGSGPATFSFSGCDKL